MPKTITLRVEEALYNKIVNHAKIDNRSLSNYIETATIKYINQTELMDDYEMLEIQENHSLVKRMRQGSKDAENKRGRFV